MDQRNRKLADLVERHYALLYRYAYRLTGCEADAEDLTQQAFLTAQARWDQLRDETKAKSWLFTIARNAYLKELRGPVCIPSSALDELPGKPPAKSLGATSEDGPCDFDQEQLQNVLNDLPEEFRSPIVLFYFEEFSYKEIAEQMDVPVGTIMSRLARAKAYLRQRLSAGERVRSVATSGSVTASTGGSVSTPLATQWAIPPVAIPKVAIPKAAIPKVATPKVRAE
jgi:RNA polymerase sigma-70 factor (ECF subfamily)